MTATRVAGLFALLALGAVACADPEQPYQKKPEPTAKAEIPAVPNLPALVRKEGDAWTIHGLVHDFRSSNHNADVEGGTISIVGYIVKTNLKACAKAEELDGKKEQCAPVCSVHERGKNDTSPNCKAPEPEFWIGEQPKLEDNTELIQVVGWATNFANIHDAIEIIDKTDPEKKDKDKDYLEKIKDGTMQTNIPDPLPAVGAKVKVTGVYGAQARRGQALIDPNYGVLTMDSIQYITPAPELATLPGMKERKKPDEKKKK